MGKKRKAAVNSQVEVTEQKQTVRLNKVCQCEDPAVLRFALTVNMLLNHLQVVGMCCIFVNAQTLIRN